MTLSRALEAISFTPTQRVFSMPSPDEPAGDQRPVDISNCANEPIHIPSAIQPHGLLFCIADDFTILQVSDNTSSLLGVQAADLVGTNLGESLEPDQLLALKAYLDFGKIKTLVPITICLKTQFEAPLSVACFAHKYDGYCILEFEPDVPEQSLPQFMLPAKLSASIDVLQRESIMLDCLQAAATRIKELTGYDRVMVYRFDEDWHGEVVAEAKEDSLEPLLGLHYPASDIPVQARELYKRNLLRMITDVEYNSVALVPRVNPVTERLLDMSDCVLRSVSPIHVEYLQNMGVRATMTISIIVNGNLWGLVACHHYSPKFLPLWLRSACELLGQLVSLRLLGFIETERYRAEAASIAMLDEVFNYQLIRSLSEAESFEKHAEKLIDVFACCGVARLSEGKLNVVGSVPKAEIVTQLAAIFDARTEVVASSRSLSDLLGVEAPAEFGGVLAMRTSTRQSEWLFCFRSEQTMLVKWAGDPRKSVEVSSDGVRLHPRGSFAVWSEEVKGTSQPWMPSELASAKLLRERFLTLQQESLERERQQAESLAFQREELLAALTHDLRNPIAGTIQLLEFVQMGKLGNSLVELKGTFAELVRAQKLLLERLTTFLLTHKYENRGTHVARFSVDLKQMVDTAVSLSKLSSVSEGVTLSIVVPEEIKVMGDADALSRVVENLLSNAIKFSNCGGSVSLVVEQNEQAVTIIVQDAGPGVNPDDMPYLFDRFWQGEVGRRVAVGSGLGLFSCKKIIEAHEGRIWCESHLGEGSKFCIELPKVLAA